MLNLLRVIDNPGIDIPLLSVLCSPMYAFTPDELAEMRCESRKSSLYSSVCEYAKQTIRQENLLMNLKFCVIVPVQIPLTLSFQKRVKLRDLCLFRLQSAVMIRHLKTWSCCVNMQEVLRATAINPF